MSNKIMYTVGGVFLVIAVVAVVGLGIWAYQLNTNLAATQKQSASLQSDYNKLKADDTQVTANLSQAQATLAQTKSDLAKAQTNLTTANSDKTALQSKIDAAKSFMAVVDADFVNGENLLGIETQVKATGDAKLINLLDTDMKTPNAANATAYYDYLFEAIDNALK